MSLSYHVEPTPASVREISTRQAANAIKASPYLSDGGVELTPREPNQWQRAGVVL